MLALGPKGRGKESSPVRAMRQTGRKRPFKGHICFFFTGEKWRVRSHSPFQEYSIVFGEKCKVEKERGKQMKAEMEGTCPPEKSVPIYKTTRCHNPEKYNLNHHRNENFINAQCVPSLESSHSLPMPKVTCIPVVHGYLRPVCLLHCGTSRKHPAIYWSILLLLLLFLLLWLYSALLGIGLFFQFLNPIHSW
jgi:hypothetical protein